MVLRTISNRGGIDAGFRAFAQGLLWQIQNELYKEADASTMAAPASASTTPFFEKLHAAFTITPDKVEFKAKIRQFDLFIQDALKNEQDILSDIKNVLRNILKVDSLSKMQEAVTEFFSTVDRDAQGAKKTLLENIWLKYAWERFNELLTDVKAETKNAFEEELNKLAEFFLADTEGRVENEDGFKLFVNYLCAEPKGSRNIASPNSKLAKFIEIQSKAEANEMTLQYLADYFDIKLIINENEQEKTETQVKPTIFINLTKGLWRNQVGVFPHCTKEPMAPQEKVTQDCLRYAREEFSKAEIKDVLEKVYQNRWHHKELAQKIIQLCNEGTTTIKDVMTYIRSNMPKNLNLDGHFASCIHYLNCRYDGIDFVQGMREIVQESDTSQFLRYKKSNELTDEEIKIVFDSFLKSDRLLSKHFETVKEIAAKEAQKVAADTKEPLLATNKLKELSLAATIQTVCSETGVLKVGDILNKIKNFIDELDVLPSDKFCACVNYVFYRAGITDTPIQRLLAKVNAQAEERQQAYARS